MSRCDVGFGVRFTVVREYARTRLGIDKTLSSNLLSLAPLYTYIQLIPTHSNYLSLVLARYAWRHTDLEGFRRYSCVASQSHLFTSTQSHTWDVSRLVCRVSHLPSSAESAESVCWSFDQSGINNATEGQPLSVCVSAPALSVKQYTKKRI